MVLVVDIEGVGDEISLQPVLSVGWVVCARIKFDDTSKIEEEIFEKGRVSFQSEFRSGDEANKRRHTNLLAAADGVDRPGRSGPEITTVNGWIFSRRCWDEFWCKQPYTLLAQLMTEAKIPEAAIREFLEVEKRWPVGEVMSDNPAYDLTRLDFAIERYSDRNYGMHFTRTGKYRTVSDPSEVYHHLPLEVRSKIVPEPAATHFPDDDALDIYRFAIKVKNAINDWSAKRARIL